MHRFFFFLLGILECTLALVLVWLGWQLPSTLVVRQGFQSADRVTQRAGRQIHILRREVQELRRPELRQLAERLRSQTLSVTGSVKRQPVDFDTLTAMRDSLAEIAASLDGLARALEPVGPEPARQPELRATLRRSAGLLQTSSRQLDQALGHRDRYEETLRQSVAIAETFAATLPLLTEQLDSRLAEEEHALDELEGSIAEVQASLPAYETTAVQLVQAGRWLAWLLAAWAGLHGTFLCRMTAR